MVNRRDFLKLGLLSGGAVLLPAGRLGSTALGADVQSPPVTAFAVDLPIPPIARPETRDGVDYYRITARRTDVEILPGRRTPVWAYDGSVPGPTIMARTGRPVVVTHVNELVEPTTVHHHGAVVDGDNDGHPDDLIAPGGTRAYALPNRSFGPRAEQSARTMWYHDHAMHHTGRNVYNGLAGFYLIADDSPASAALPSGEHDIPLMITDRLFDADGQLVYTFPDEFKNGVPGDTILVNGAVQPRLVVGTRRYRFRVLNASSALPYQLRLSNGQPFQVVATEGGYLERPVTVQSLFIAQAERYEVVIDFAQVPLGTSIVVENMLGSGRTGRVMRFDVLRRLSDDSTVPDRLRTIEFIPPAQATVARTFRFGRHNGQYTINDKVYDARRFDAQPRSGATEIWTFMNEGGGWTHPVHVHLTDFQVLDRDGRPPRPYEVGWKETVHLPPNGTARVVLTWPDVPPDVLGRPARAFRDRYVFHCHNLEHEDDDMMAQLRVVAAS